MIYPFPNFNGCGMKILIHSQTSTVQLLKFWNGYLISSHNLLITCDYLSILELKLIQVSKRGPCWFVLIK